MFTAVLLALFAIFCVVVIRGMLSRTPGEGRARRAASIACLCLVLYGFGAFLAQGLAATRTFDAFGPGFEWPIGLVGAVRDSHGRYVAAHKPTDRIQIYDADGRFVRGWSVDASAGAFKLRVTPDDRIEVVTARGQKRLSYSPDGELIQEGQYNPGEYAAFENAPTEWKTFGTPWVLWPFTHPVFGWSVGMVGGLGLGLLERARRRQPARAL
jgi:hypothetical protein